jgi:hypothetical protein
MDGVDAIHCGRSGWYDTCPKCGDKPPSEESLRASAGGVELGFAKPATERKSGIASCASFSWAQSPAIVRAACETAIGEPAVVDEYGRALTGGEFLQMLRANCPIEFTGSIGQEFF